VRDRLQRELARAEQSCRELAIERDELRKQATRRGVAAGILAATTLRGMMKRRRRRRW
jgi:nitrate reductase gamma subunit